MLGRLMPREGKFFDLFNAHAEQIVLGAEHLLGLMRTLGRDADRSQAHAAEIDAIEDRADKITHQTVALLHSTFITPLDRDEIHQLISRLDDVIDMIQAAAQMIDTYDLRDSTPEAVRFAEIILDSARKVAEAVALLSDMDNSRKIMVATRDIGTLEADADQVLRESLSKIFRTEPDVRQLIKLKDLYESLEMVTDHCDDVGNMLESIVLENA
ncbi:DUF47 domain-containing protein [Solimonas marina]|uniref:DUF47 domain-containing protein n=1 Tax=Solimonas marina TaxID=2714601 RepID=A0A969WEL6_9GAMM|nr:DUF47 family protein [Solimonas marina]NKF24715.1 DUF47 domain-containing protein [Solimonas marina]